MVLHIYTIKSRFLQVHQSSISSKFFFFSEPGTNKFMMTNSIHNPFIRSNCLPYQHIFRHHNSMNLQSSVDGSMSGGGLSPCAQKNFMMQNPNTTMSCYNNGYSNQTLMVCSPSTVAGNIQDNNMARSMPIGANLSNPMTLTKYPSMNSSSSPSALSPVSYTNYLIY